ncbi:hypothetical protein [Enterobacter hormaechei]|uniref:hypothetical protein n=1 Tax=Enterobacter hormaechei TaxID=158836 RepID=UPI001F11DCEB|nr:hypothetical protein [Enterobacter hormaechei]MCO7368101.1 hypothetical protein [Enterobacter hormaechei]
MTKQYPSKQYLSEVISNREFAESVPPEIVIVMARQLLAGLEQEPVYQVLGDGSWTDYSKQQLEDLLESKPSTLFRVAYAAPQLPQPAVVDADDNFYSWFGREWRENYQQNQYTAAAKQMLGVMAESAWRAGRRSAMLQGAEPVSQPCTLREGVAAIRNSGIAIDADKIQAERDALNSPVIPDGWVAVPVEPTIAILDEFDSIIDYGAEDSKDAWSRLLAAAWIKSLPAAPQQEVKSGR